MGRAAGGGGFGRGGGAARARAALGACRAGPGARAAAAAAQASTPPAHRAPRQCPPRGAPGPRRPRRIRAARRPPLISPQLFARSALGSPPAERLLFLGLVLAAKLAVLWPLPLLWLSHGARRARPAPPARLPSRGAPRLCVRCSAPLGCNCQVAVSRAVWHRTKVCYYKINLGNKGTAIGSGCHKAREGEITRPGRSFT